MRDKIWTTHHSYNDHKFGKKTDYQLKFYRHDLDKNKTVRLCENGSKEKIKFNGSPIINFTPNLTGRFSYQDRQTNVKKWGISPNAGLCDRPLSLNSPTNYMPQ